MNTLMSDRGVPLSLCPVSCVLCSCVLALPSLSLFPVSCLLLRASCSPFTQRVTLSHSHSHTHVESSVPRVCILRSKHRHERLRKREATCVIYFYSLSLCTTSIVASVRPAVSYSALRPTRDQRIAQDEPPVQ